MYGKPTLPESKMFYNADGRVVHTNMKYCSICGSLADLALISINLAGNAGLKTAPFEHVAAYAPTWDATVEAHQNEINELKATIQHGVKLLTKLLHG